MVELTIIYTKPLTYPYNTTHTYKWICINYQFGIVLYVNLYIYIYTIWHSMWHTYARVAQVYSMNEYFKIYIVNCGYWRLTHDGHQRTNYLVRLFGLSLMTARSLLYMWTIELNYNVWQFRDKISNQIYNIDRCNLPITITMIFLPIIPNGNLLI